MSDHQLQRSFVWKEEANRDTQAKQAKLFCKSFLKGINLHPSIVLSILPKHFCPAPLKMKAFLVIPFFLNSSDTILPLLTCTLAVKKATYTMIQYQNSILNIFRKNGFDTFLQPWSCGRASSFLRAFLPSRKPENVLTRWSAFRIMLKTVDVHLLKIQKIYIIAM